MARTSRRHSISGFYHVILRGVNRQDIFHDDTDRKYFLKVMGKFKDETDTEIITYCLMTNHIHLLVKSENDLGTFVKKIASSYVYYFNKKYCRIGHLFQDRFKSEPVDTESYLLTVARYILKNPEKAHICPADRYKWNSWREISDMPSLCSVSILYEVAGNKDLLMEFLHNNADDECMEYDESVTLSDAEAMDIIKKYTGPDVENFLYNCSLDKRDLLISSLKSEGLTGRQISRLTGIGRSIIQKIK